MSAFQEPAWSLKPASVPGEVACAMYCLATDGFLRIGLSSTGDSELGGQPAAWMKHLSIQSLSRFVLILQQPGDSTPALKIQAPLMK